jgi:hypothetical protein
MFKKYIEIAVIAIVAVAIAKHVPFVKTYI